LTKPPKSWEVWIGQWETIISRADEADLLDIKDFKG
jgi:hypothetical protein